VYDETAAGALSVIDYQTSFTAANQVKFFPATSERRQVIEFSTLGAANAGNTISLEFYSYNQPINSAFLNQPTIESLSFEVTANTNISEIKIGSFDYSEPTGLSDTFTGNDTTTLYVYYPCYALVRADSATDNSFIIRQSITISTVSSNYDLINSGAATAVDEVVLLLPGQYTIGYSGNPGVAGPFTVTLYAVNVSGYGYPVLNQTYTTSDILFFNN
jgi:hypothetical protein